jgi:hypothetical protein
MRGKPVRVARIAVEHHRVGFQFFFELFAAECNGLAVIVRAYDFEIHAIAHDVPDGSAPVVTNCISEHVQEIY